MSEADLLALSDAVLSLSLNTINMNLYLMQLENVLRSKWSVAWSVDSTTKAYTIDDSAEASANISNWVSIRQAASAAFAKGDFVTFGTLMGTLDKNYSGAWDATIKSFMIEAIPDVSDRVLLKVTFAKGTLAMPDSAGFSVTSYDMKDVVYAFETKLSSLTVDIGNDSMLPRAETAARSAIAASGLSSDNFTIESIFMDVQRSNIANYSSADSELPKGSETAVATAISTMFNHAMAEEETRKYLLGYALQQTQLKKVDKAIFQPTAVSYSTTYVKPHRKQEYNPESSFNFHLQVDGGKPETQQVLPVALLSGHMTDPEVDGVFALRYSKFDAEVLEDIVPSALTRAAEGFDAGKVIETEAGRRWQISGSRKSSTNDIGFNLKSDDGKKPKKITEESMTVTAQVRAVKGVLQLSFETELTHTQRYQAFRLTKAIEDIGKAIGNVFKGKKSSVGEYDEVLRATCTTSRGSTGIVVVDIKPGAMGKLTASTPRVTRQLDVGLSSSHVSDHFSDFVGNYEAIFSGKNPVDYIMDKIKAALRSANPSQSAEKALSDRIKKAVDLTGQVDALSVVMPLGNLYTFKELSLRENSVSKVLEATVGYAPIEAANGN